MRPEMSNTRQQITGSEWKEVLPDLPATDVALLRLIRSASQGITSFVDPAVRPSGLTENSYHVLTVIAASGERGIRPASLCRQTGTSPANMTRVLWNLSCENLIQTRRAGPSLRQRWVSATPSGRQLVERCGRTLRPIVQTALSSLSTSEKSQLDQLLRSVVAAMGEAASLSESADS